MFRNLPLGVIVFSLTLLAAAEPSDAPPTWAAKRVAEWNEKDAVQVLFASPWAKMAAPTLLPALTAFERRDGGNIAAQGGGQGMQLDRLKDFSVVGAKGASPHETRGPKTLPDKLPIRWESALPVRLAEFKNAESGVPDIDGEEYAVAVYDVSLKLASIDSKDYKDLPGELRKISTLKIEGKDGIKEVRPSRVLVIQQGNGVATVVYLFPRAVHIAVDDTRVEFDAQVGRIAVGVYFFPPQMQFQGKLEL
jgi:hypothetical protein